MGGKEVIYSLRKHSLAEVNVTNRKYGRQHRVGRSQEGKEDIDTYCGAGVVAVGLGTGEHADLEFIVIVYRYGKEGCD